MRQWWLRRALRLRLISGLIRRHLDADSLGTGRSLQLAVRRRMPPLRHGSRGVIRSLNHRLKVDGARPRRERRLPHPGRISKA